MAPDDCVPSLRVSVAYSPGPGQIDEVELNLPRGASIALALARSGLQDRHPDLALANATVGVWGVIGVREQALCDGDRVEVYRALRIDPMQARRRRAQNQRALKSPRR